MSWSDASPGRESARQSQFDYTSRGVYLVSFCTVGRRPLLGTLRAGDVELSPLGAILRDEWLRTPFLRPDVELDAFVVMPDHFHGIMRLVAAGALGRSSLVHIIGGLKAATTVRANAADATPGRRLWQRSFHDRRIRDVRALDRVRAYIRDNPVRAWHAMMPRSIHTRGQPAVSEAEGRP